MTAGLHFSPASVARRFKGAAWLAFATEGTRTSAGMHEVEQCRSNCRGVVDTTSSIPTERTPDRACHWAAAVGGW